jgi:hypothetical protein
VDLGVGGTSSNAEENIPNNEEEEWARFRLARDNRLEDRLSPRFGKPELLLLDMGEVSPKLGGYVALGCSRGTDMLTAKIPTVVGTVVAERRLFD